MSAHCDFAAYCSKIERDILHKESDTIWNSITFGDTYLLARATFIRCCPIFASTTPGRAYQSLYQLLEASPSSAKFGASQYLGALARRSELHILPSGHDDSQLMLDCQH